MQLGPWCPGSMAMIPGMAAVPMVQPSIGAEAQFLDGAMKIPVTYKSKANIFQDEMLIDFGWLTYLFWWQIPNTWWCMEESSKTIGKPPEIPTDLGTRVEKMYSTKNGSEDHTIGRQPSTVASNLIPTISSILSIRWFGHSWVNQQKLFLAYDQCSATIRNSFRQYHQKTWSNTNDPTHVQVNHHWFKKSSILSIRIAS